MPSLTEDSWTGRIGAPTYRGLTPLRRVLEIESFIQEPVDREEKQRPEVGLRWGRPANFEVIDTRGDDPKLTGSSTDVKDTHKIYFVNNISTRGEQFRRFTVGRVKVLPTKVDFDTSSWSSWQSHVKGQVGVGDESIFMEDVEDIYLTIMPANITYETQHSIYTVYFSMNIGPQVVFDGQPSSGDRGEYPTS